MLMPYPDNLATRGTLACYELSPNHHCKISPLLSNMYLEVAELTDIDIISGGSGGGGGIPRCHGIPIWHQVINMSMCIV